MKTFSDFLSELTGQVGQGTLADQIGMDGANLSRFRSGQGTISLACLDKLFEIADACIVSCADRRRLEDALETISKLWSQEKNRMRNGSKP